MRYINENRQRRVQLLEKTLEDIVAARRELLRQLEDLDARGRAVRLEHNTLHNLDAPTSELPAEVLAMIFEEGTYQQDNSPPFGVLVSHVTRRWRDIAISTSCLWADICIQVKPHMRHRERTTEQWVATFLSRASSLPINISIKGLHYRDFTNDFIQLIGEVMGRCRHFRIKKADPRGLSRTLEYLSNVPAPILDTLYLGADGQVKLQGRIFSSGAPCLTTVHLSDINLSTMHLCFPAFKSVTTMQLERVCIDRDDEDLYDALRDGLMNMPSLHHLELQFLTFRIPSTRLPVYLPTLQLLNVHTKNGGGRSAGRFVQSIQAASLDTLSLTASPDFHNLHHESFANTLEGVHFPSLRHLILCNAHKNFVDLDLFARTFPDVERLTIQMLPDECDIVDIFAAVLKGIGNGEEDEDDEADQWQRWPKLRTIAVSASGNWDAPAALGNIGILLEACRQPISKLMLPKSLTSQAGIEAVAELRNFVELEDFSVDWATPFLN